MSPGSRQTPHYRQSCWVWVWKEDRQFLGRRNKTRRDTRCPHDIGSPRWNGSRGRSTGPERRAGKCWPCLSFLAGFSADCRRLWTMLVLLLAGDHWFYFWYNVGFCEFSFWTSLPFSLFVTWLGEHCRDGRRVQGSCAEEYFVLWGLGKGCNLTNKPPIYILC